MKKKDSFGKICAKNDVGALEILRFEERFEKLCFRDGLVWTVGPTGEINQCFQILRRGVHGALDV